MASYNKFQPFVENLAEKKMDLGSDQLMVALTNTAPTGAEGKLSDITEISYTNLSSRNLTTVSSAQTAGVYKLTLADLTLTASGSVGPFRYIVIYDNTSTDKNLICWFDYGSSVTLGTGESITLDFTNELFSLA